MEPVGSPWWIGDSVPSRHFPLYTRGNAGEVFPNVVSPLTGSLFADASVRAQTRVFQAMGVVVDRDMEDGVVAFSGVFGGYLYLNLSYGRVLGARAPGMRPADVDEQLFGTSGAPPYRRRAGDRSAVAGARMTANLVREFLRPDVGVADAAASEAATWVASLPDVTSSSDQVLLDLVPTFPHRLDLRFQSLLRATSPGATARALMDRLVRGGLGDRTDDLLNRLTSGIGSVDSAQLAAGLWALGRRVAEVDVLTDAFDAGIDGVLARLRADPQVDAQAFVGELDGFLHDHGHRGPDEYELATPNWAMDPKMVIAAIDRLRFAPAERSPELAHGRLAADREQAIAEAMSAVPRPARAVFRRALHLATLGAPARERAKDAFVLELAGMRAVLHELVHRARERCGPSEVRDGFLVTADELPAFVADPPAFAERIATRADRRDLLNERVPPFWFDGAIPDPLTWPRRTEVGVVASTTPFTLHGIGVCSGSAAGRARVLTDANDPSALGPGDVLVAPFTDPAWTPLFLAAVAVVVDVGAVQSHAAIVARELGIPAVVSATDASRRIPDGAWVVVDGDTGTVSVTPADGSGHE